MRTTTAKATAISIVIVHRQPLVGAGLSALFAAHHNSSPVHLIAAPAVLEEALEIIRDTSPRVVLLVLPLSRPWLEVLGKVRMACDSARVVLLSGASDCRLAASAIEADAAGHLSLAISLAELEKGIRLAAEGHRIPFDEHGSFCHCQRAVPPPAVLSPRQLEVLTMISRGKGTKQIAFALGVSNKTVEAHRARPRWQTSIAAQSTSI